MQWAFKVYLKMWLNSKLTGKLQKTGWKSQLQGFQPCAVGRMLGFESLQTCKLLCCFLVVFCLVFLSCTYSRYIFWWVELGPSDCGYISEVHDLQEENYFPWIENWFMLIYFHLFPLAASCGLLQPQKDREI